MGVQVSVKMNGHLRDMAGRDSLQEGAGYSGSGPTTQLIRRHWKSWKVWKTSGAREETS